MMANVRIDSAVVQRLLEAAEGLERDGWCQGRYVEDGKRCLMSAVCSGPNADVNDRAILAVGYVIRSSPVYWNDEPGRTMEQVVAVIRETAGLVEAGKLLAPMETS